MYMNQNELYIDKVTNLAFSGIDETKSASLSSSTNGATVTTNLSFSSPPIGCLAGIYRANLSLSVSGGYFQNAYSSTGVVYFSLGGTYRSYSNFACSLANISLTNIKVVSGTHIANPDSSANTKTYSGTQDLHSYVRVA